MIALLAVAALAQQSVSPPEAASLRPVELAELVTDLLPAEGSAQRGWTPAEDARIAWITPDPSPSGEHLGLARVTVAGQASTFEGRELAWSVVVRPDLIKIEPGTPQIYCFGAAFTGCSFSPAGALEGLDLRPVCADDFGGFSRVEVYEATAEGRRAFVRHTLSGDAEGANAWLEISLAPLACEI